MVLVFDSSGGKDGIPVSSGVSMAQDVSVLNFPNRKLRFLRQWEGR